MMAGLGAASQEVVCFIASTCACNGLDQATKFHASSSYGHVCKILCAYHHTRALTLFMYVPPRLSNERKSDNNSISPSRSPRYARMQHDYLQRSGYGSSYHRPPRLSNNSTRSGTAAPAAAANSKEEESWPLVAKGGPPRDKYTHTHTHLHTLVEMLTFFVGKGGSLLEHSICSRV